MEYIGAGSWVSLVSSALLVFILFSALGWGRLVNDVLIPQRPFLGRAETALWSLAAGIVVLAATTFLLGSWGIFGRVSAGFLLGAGVFLSLRMRAEWVDFKRVRLTALQLIFCGAALLVCFLAWLQAVSPTTGMDALAYHLYLIKEFLRIGRMEFLPQTRESLWPFNTEMLFMLGLLFQGTALAQLLHWIFYPLTAGVVYACTRRFYSEHSARWAALFFLFTPAAFAQSGHPYVDLSLAFFIFLAVYVFLLITPTSGAGLYALSGFFCGAAVGTKYLGLGCLMILFIFVFIRSRANIRNIACFSAAAFVAGGTWYVRSWCLAGNPVFPLFHTLFGGNGYPVDIAAGVGMGKGMMAFFLFPWNLTLYPRFFGGEMIGALFLVFLPTLIPLIRNARTTSRLLAVFGFLYIVFTFSQSHQARFYIAVVPFLSVGAGVAFAGMLSRRGFLRIIAIGTVALLLTAHLGIFIYRVRDKWPVAVGVISAESWLKVHERSFQGHDYIRRHVLPSETLLNAAEVRYFYAPDGWKITHLAQENVRLRREKQPLMDYLRQSRFDYIWASDASEPGVLAYLKENRYIPVFRYDFREKPDTFRNVIYKKPPALTVSDHQ